MDDFTPAVLERCADELAARHPLGRPLAAMVAGSGIHLDVGGWSRAAEVPFSDVFPFPIHALQGHTPTLTVWRRNDRSVLVFNGRFHLYQGYTPAQVASIPRLAALLGAGVYVATNAAGGLDPRIETGSIVVLSDHINLQGENALVGDWGRWRGPTFPDMVDAYDPELRALAAATARAVGFTVREGVYAGMLGPNYETPAEVRMLAAMGATVVGMSTVQEVLAARQMGLRIMALSLVTNTAAGLSDRPLSHQEVLEAGDAARANLAELLQRIVSRLEELDP